MGEARRRATRRVTNDMAATRPFLVASQWESLNQVDDEEPIWTFRVALLGSISFLFLLILNKYFLKQTSECIMGMASTLIVLYPLGYIMGKAIPNTRVYYPTLGGLEFSTNPGHFSGREYAIISILANMGAVIGGFTSNIYHW
ncbi:hypothetical protein Salat_1159000 [Sesamum alatum]|uniref:Oligopeptide transporter n=1 Tax=Sesamum alatum TaxID=300844 RepID=A0AAE1YEJ0_9LAMI|nr:hypothetical protein Salat_1159000 [Sesamum alatum]